MVPEIQQTLARAVNEVVVTLLSLLVTGVLPYGIILARQWMLAKIAAVKDKNLRDSLTFALERIDFTAATVTAELEATTKKFTDAGKVIDPGKLKAFAIERVKKGLPTKALAAIKAGYDDPDMLERMVSSKVEEKALSLKLQRCRRPTEGAQGKAIDPK